MIAARAQSHRDPRPSWRAAAAAVLLLLSPLPALGQHQHHTPAPVGDGWTWSASGQAFLTANLQWREFTDFHQVESQNWFMGTGARKAWTGAVSLVGMLSLEPFTMRDLGSAQVFQTGETFEGTPLVDYQHPHDLFMHLSAGYSRPLGSSALLRLSGALVGDPALGPTVFMHRASSAPNPTAPLSHHQLDSTHITPGVVLAGVDRGRWSIEASAFHGREPDENRLDIDLGALDSWSTRVWWRRDGWAVQASGARVNEPDAIEPGDVTKLSASIEYSGQIGGRDAAMTLAWGQNRERFANEDGWLAEGTFAAWPSGTFYTRGEIADKHILEAGGIHPPGFEHPHIMSTVGAWTLGYDHRLLEGRAGRISVGGDATVYYTPRNLFESYGHPVSIHAFLRWYYPPGRLSSSRR